MISIKEKYQRYLNVLALHRHGFPCKLFYVYWDRKLKMFSIVTSDSIPSIGYETLTGKSSCEPKNIKEYRYVLITHAIHTRITR